MNVAGDGDVNRCAPLESSGTSHSRGEKREN